MRRNNGKNNSKNYVKNSDCCPDYYPSLNTFWLPTKVGKQGVPIIAATQEIPGCLLSYGSFRKSLYMAYRECYPEQRITISFFIDDFKFNSCWLKSKRTLEIILKDGYDSVLSPDFTLSFDFPEVINRWNHYRKMWVTAYWQSQGLTVIPVANWLDESSYEWCFEGMPMNSTIAVSTSEISMNHEFDCFRNGLEETVKQLSPSCIICYGTKWMTNINEIFSTKIIFYRSREWVGAVTKKD
jgi:hypothetical protein